MAHSWQHFTGPKGGKRIRRKSKTPKKHGPHKSRYAHLVPETDSKKFASRENKKFRIFPLVGKPGQVFLTGIEVIFHGRIYRLMKSVVIADIGETLGEFEMVRQA